MIVNCIESRHIQNLKMEEIEQSLEFNSTLNIKCTFFLVMIGKLKVPHCHHYWIVLAQMCTCRQYLPIPNIWAIKKTFELELTTQYLWAQILNGHNCNCNSSTFNDLYGKCYFQKFCKKFLWNDKICFLANLLNTSLRYVQSSTRVHLLQELKKKCWENKHHLFTLNCQAINSNCLMSLPS